MSVFRLTDEGDLYRPASASTFERVGGAQQGIQHLRTRLRLFTREVFRDQRIGVQFFEIVTHPGFSTSAIANHIASVALATPGIVEPFQLGYTYEPVRAVVTMEISASFQLEDQRTRVPIHENFDVNIGGSTQT
jgi:hypothetical protein